MLFQLDRVAVGAPRLLTGRVAGYLTQIAHILLTVLTMEITHAEQRRKARRLRKQRAYQRAYRERLKEAEAAMAHEDMRVGGLTSAEWDAVFRLEGMPRIARLY